jgi:uncharacterized membrane protein
VKKYLIVFLALILICGVVWVITQVKPSITKTAQVSLQVLPKPDFTLAVSPDHIVTYVGRSLEVSFGATVTSVNSFAGTVNFSVAGLPAGFTVSFFPSSQLILGAGETKGVQINIDVADSAELAGEYTISITAQSTNYN